jgi:hypothetical protein
MGVRLQGAFGPAGTPGKHPVSAAAGVPSGANAPPARADAAPGGE